MNKLIKNLINNKKEITVNIVLVIITVVITINCIRFIDSKKIKNKDAINKDIQKYNGEELVEPNSTGEVINESAVKEETLETQDTTQEKISEDSTITNTEPVPDPAPKPEVIATSVGYSSEVTPQTMKIMGYEEIDIDKAITFIIGLVGENNIDKIRLNGTSLNFHISNTNKAAKSEDVNAYFVLAQQLLETGNLKFENSSVKPEYYNFAGLGATDSNPKPNKFFSNYEGQLAQVQHLKAYASTDPLNEECKDQRFNLLSNKRGTAVNAEELSNKWASNATYGESLAEMYNQFHSTESNKELVSKYKYMELK